jgi:hypothetical protein
LVLLILSIQAMRRATRDGMAKMQLVARIFTGDAVTAAAVGAQISTSSLNTKLADQGLPDGQVLSVTVVALANDGRAGGNLSNGDLAGIAVCGAVALLLGVSLCFRSYGVRESEEEIALAAGIAELRNKLHIRRRDGFVLSSDKVPFWLHRYHFVQIPRSHMEAAVRLELQQDFDVGLFDALCILLRDGQDRPLVHRAPSTEEKPASSTRTDGTSEGGSTVQWAALEDWLLGISADLLRSGITLERVGDKSLQYKLREQGCDLEERERFVFFRLINFKVKSKDSRI